MAWHIPWVYIYLTGKQRYSIPIGQMQNKPDSLISVPINSMAEDRNGAIWFGTWNDGLFKVSPPFLISRFLCYRSPKH